MQNQSLPALDQLICLLIASKFPVTVRQGKFYINNIPAEYFIAPALHNNAIPEPTYAARSSRRRH